jgi:hypothetical protein
MANEEGFKAFGSRITGYFSSWREVAGLRDTDLETLI